MGLFSVFIPAVESCFHAICDYNKQMYEKQAKQAHICTV